MWEVWLWAALCSGLVLSAPRLGESTELSWLLVHDSPQQSPLLLRRITPKSVFLTPTFSSCSEGYRQDGMGRCVKVVKLDQQAQWEFFLQKLNSMYAAPPEPSRKENPGPLKLPIPIEEEPPSTTSEPVTEATSTTTTIATTIPTTMPTTPQTTETTAQPTTEPPFLIVVANTTEPLETTTEVMVTDGSTTEEVFQTTEISTIASTQETAESAMTESILPVRNTVRFPLPDGRKRPSSYIRFPEHYPSAIPPPTYWWPHSWDRSQISWPPPSFHSRPPYHRERHWAATTY